MCKYEIDLASIVEDTERTRFCLQTDRRWDGQTDRQTDGQGETRFTPLQLHWSGGYKILHFSKHSFPNLWGVYCLLYLPHNGIKVLYLQCEQSTAFFTIQFRAQLHKRPLLAHAGPVADSALGRGCQAGHLLVCEVYQCHEASRRGQVTGRKHQFLAQQALRRQTAGLCLNIKTIFPKYGDSHVKDKTVVRPSYL